MADPSLPGDVTAKLIQARQPQDDVEARRLRSRVTEGLGAGSAPAPVTIDRFVVLERIGSGGLGVVYAAYDPKLDRKVALKLLHPGTEGATDQGEGRARFVREAKAMAKLSHPNVLPVYDAGIHDDEVFLVLELVEGKQLGTWLEEKKRTWREVVEVFLKAGRGLAAAHAAGLVHRDFKPGNVLIGKDGRIRVMDFGLATPAPSIEQAQVDMTPSGSGGISGSGEIDTGDPFKTQPGTIMGTPAYMAPEQHKGGEVDAKADQFAFCVTLHEGLYGERPFEWKTPEELVRAVRKGRVRPAPADTKVPGWLRKIVLRGLSVSPEDRWPAMEALLDALGKDPRTLWRRVGVAAAGLAVAVAGGMAYGQYVEQQEQLCSDSDTRLAGVWDDTQRQTIRDAILATSLSYRADTWQRVERILDEYTGIWAKMHRENCEATRIRGEQSADRMHLRMACLEKRLWEVEGLTKVLAKADDQVVENAVGAATALTPVQRCAGDDLRVEMAVPDAPEARESVAALRARLAEAKGLEDAGKYADGVVVAGGVVDEAAEVGYVPLVAEARYRLGSLHRQAGNYAKAETELLESIWAAEEGRLDEIAARAQSLLVMVVGYHKARYDEGRLWARHAEAKIRRLRGAEDIEAELLAHRGVLNDEAARYDEATRQLKRALAMRVRIFGPTHPLVALSRKQLGNVYYQQNLYDEAYEQYARALQIREQTFGPSHPSVAMIHNNLGIVLESKGDHVEARGQHERALAIWEATLDPDHPNLALSRHNLAITLALGGEHERARREYERSLAINETSLGASHPRTALVHAHLGSELMYLGDPERARDHYEKARAIWRERHGTEHPDYAYALALLGDWSRDQGDWAQALDHHTQALAIRERALGSEAAEVADSLASVGVLHVRVDRSDLARPLLRRALDISKDENGNPYPDAGVILRELGRILLQEGRREEAVENLENAVKRHEKYARGDVGEAAETRALLAKTLWEGGDKARARKLAKRARGDFKKAGATYRRSAAALDAWLAAHK
jgi:tetratricopeptide (TPR) repeat protein/predicted Ser/Thr protein kinase